MSARAAARFLPRRMLPALLARSGPRVRGLAGEALAERYLATKRYRILARNWRGSRGELDLVCSLNRLLVFVEVKTRTSRSALSFGSLDAVHRAKRAHILKCAGEYQAQNALRLRRLGLHEMRFDALAVEIPLRRGAPVIIEHWPGAFPAAPT